MLRTNERADFRGGVASRPKAKFLGFRYAQSCERFADGFFDEKSFDGQTDLTAIRVASPTRRPVATLPVNRTLSGAASINACPTSPPPWTMVTRFFGKPASRKSLSISAPH